MAIRSSLIDTYRFRTLNWSRPLGVREYLQSRGGKNIAIAVVIIGVLAAGISIWSNVRPSDEMADASAPVFINLQGQTKRITMEVGKPIPDGWYKAELCYWTKDGHPKATPTYVLMNRYRNKPEPTFCPDCGRMVRDHNPPAGPDVKPPPTELEYKSRH
jgi:hypothetical protein